MAYVEHHGENGADLYVQPLDADGRPVGERVRVNDSPDSVKAWKGDPPTIAVASNGAVYVGWTRKYQDADAKGNNLVLSVSADGGRTFAPPVKVNDDQRPASHGMHSLAVTADGRVIMAWLDERNVTKSPHDMSKMSETMHHDEPEPNSEVYEAFSTDGGRTFSANRRLASDACPCCKTSMLAAADGNVYVSWRQVLAGDHRHIAVAASRDAGATFDPGVIVSDDNWQLSACPVSGAALASTAKDEVEVAWYTAGAAGPAGLYFSTSRDGGKTFAGRTLIDADARSGMPVLSGTTSIFNLQGRIRVARLGEHASANSPIDIDGATLPVLAASGKTMIVAYTNDVSGQSSVWSRRLDL
jgi:hypothetical protein